MMPMHARNMAIILTAAVTLSAGSGLAADSRFEIDLKELPKAAAPLPAKSGHLPAKAVRKSAPKASSVRHVATDGNVRYTVKPGDHIFKILMRDFGLSNQQSERIIPEIARLNGIDDIRRLRVGQELVIPLTPSKRAVRHDTRSASELEPALPAETAETSAVEQAPSPVTAPAPQLQPDTASPAVPPPVTPLAEQVNAPAPQTAPVPDRPAQAVRVALHPVLAKDTDGMVDRLLDLLAPGWGRNRIVETGRESTDGSYMSIKVDRFFEQLGHRYIVSSESDPLTLTMLRLLEVKGDRVINIGREDGVTAVASRLAAKMELPRREGDFRVKCLDLPGGEFQLRGVWVSPAAPYGQQLLITGDQVPNCTADLLSGGEPPLAVK